MIIIGSDHAGYETKEFIKKQLEKLNLPYSDCGCDGSSVDYPDIAETVARRVLKTQGSKGVLICGTGIGISIAANKVSGIRAALCADCYSAKMSRLHNNANVICLGGRTLGMDVSWELLNVWLNTEFLGERHSARLDKITAIEEKEGESRNE
jgi:ribose 5-phosphate isomerase B